MIGQRLFVVEYLYCIGCKVSRPQKQTFQILAVISNKDGCISVRTILYFSVNIQTHYDLKG